MNDGIAVEIKHPFDYSWLEEEDAVPYRYVVFKHYPMTETLAVVLSPTEDLAGDAFVVVSVNTLDSGLLPKDEFVLHSTDLPEAFIKLIEQSGVAKPTAKTIHSGFVDFPVWKLTPEYAKKVEA